MKKDNLNVIRDHMFQQMSINDREGYNNSTIFAEVISRHIILLM